MISGTRIAFFEISLYLYISHSLRKYFKNLQNIDTVTYYWFIMTVLTFIWETSYIIHFNEISHISGDLIMNKNHVWTNKYPISSIIPWNLAKIFYAEYGAYADREYMLIGSDWSRTIEGSHAYLCGILAFMAIIFKIKNKNKEFLITASVSMGTQLMNSLLYMANYFIQIDNKNNVNYNRDNFPSGTVLSKRPFMYVNIFWTLMPLYAIYKLIKINYNSELIMNKPNL